MTRLAMIRHGPTRWNAAGRIQGRTDVALSTEGTAEVRRWRLPDEFAGWRCYASPLLRAVQTARLLCTGDIVFEPALGEMRWGTWEGRLLAEVRAADPRGVADIEARGLDFSAPGGESPRVVQERLKPWLAGLARADEPAIAITHKGVIRTLHALATGWPMLGKPPDRLDWSSVHLFRLASDGAPSVERLNIPLRAERDIPLRAERDDAPCPPRLF